MPMRVPLLPLLPLPRTVRDLLRDEDRASTILIGGCGMVAVMSFLSALLAMMLMS